MCLKDCGKDQDAGWHAQQYCHSNTVSTTLSQHTRKKEKEKMTFERLRKRSRRRLARTTILPHICHSILSQQYCHRNTVSTILSHTYCHSILSPQYCHSNTVSTILSPHTVTAHCHHYTILSQQYCLNNTVTYILSQHTVTTILSQQYCLNNTVTTYRHSTLSPLHYTVTAILSDAQGKMSNEYNWKEQDSRYIYI